MPYFTNVVFSFINTGTSLWLSSKRSTASSIKHDENFPSSFENFAETHFSTNLLLTNGSQLHFLSNKTKTHKGPWISRLSSGQILARLKMSERKPTCKLMKTHAASFSPGIHSLMTRAASLLKSSPNAHTRWKWEGFGLTMTLISLTIFSLLWSGGSETPWRRKWRCDDLSRRDRRGPPSHRVTTLHM